MQLVTSENLGLSSELYSKCYVTWHLPSIQMSIEPGLHGVPSITLEASFAEKRYCGSFGLQNKEHGWPETGMRKNKEDI